LLLVPHHEDRDPSLGDQFLPIAVEDALSLGLILVLVAKTVQGVRRRTICVED
jgi:hypothetical protein